MILFVSVPQGFSHPACPFRRTSMHSKGCTSTSPCRVKARASSPQQESQPALAFLAESPLITVSRTTNNKKELRESIINQLNALSSDQRDAFFSLSNVYGQEESKELGIARTNVLPLGSNAQKGAIFLEASRINHGCDNNCQNTWNESIQKLTIYATRDIREGEEITIYYLGRFSSRSSRQIQLRLSFRFDCFCGLCSANEERRIQSDRHLDEIQRIDDRVGDFERMLSRPVQVLHDIKTMLDLLQQEGISGASEARAYYDAFQVAAAHGDRARAREFANRSSSARVIAEGQDSPQVTRLTELAQDPSKHSGFGTTNMWTTSLDGSPATNAGNFDAWLWKQDEGAVTQLPDLRNSEFFPSFQELPEENSIDMEYFESLDGFSYRPRKHWCFLAEIVEVEMFLRLKLYLRDRAGHEAPLMFYTDGRGGEMSQSQLRQGYTVAVLYAEQHGFLDLSVGIRQESNNTIKILPLGLEDLFKLSDRVGKHGSLLKNDSSCHTCGQKSAARLKCSRCSLFWYCDKTCQAAGWESHKKDCKLLKDKDLQGLIRLNWADYEEYHQFS